MKQHTLAALLGIALGLLACHVAAQLANIALVTLQAEQVKMVDESGLDSNVMDY